MFILFVFVDMLFLYNWRRAAEKFSVLVVWFDSGVWKLVTLLLFDHFDLWHL